jgi:hypothetical protein
MHHLHHHAGLRFQAVAVQELPCLIALEVQAGVQALIFPVRFAITADLALQEKRLILRTKRWTKKVRSFHVVLPLLF